MISKHMILFACLIIRTFQLIFSRNNIFLSQQISEQYFQPWFFSEANGLYNRNFGVFK
jgi:hypothetical protein